MPASESSSASRTENSAILDALTRELEARPNQLNWADVTVFIAHLAGGRRPSLTFTQLANGAIGSLVLMLAFIFMMVAAFDPGRPPEITKAINGSAGSRW